MSDTPSAEDLVGTKQDHLPGDEKGHNQQDQEGIGELPAPEEDKRPSGYVDPTKADKSGVTKANRPK